jgi:hypothetical protein
MAVRFKDDEISDMLKESKRLNGPLRRPLALRSKRGHKELQIEARGQSGKRYRFIIRQSEFNVLDFSVILAHVPDDGIEFRLRRYNGSSHEHQNLIERERFDGFHIHTATARYQDRGAKEDSFAVPSDKYGDLEGAVSLALVDFGIHIDRPETPLFEGWINEH